MKKRPTLLTERLLLRPFWLSDANTVQTLAGDRDIAATTATIPHPYETGAAEKWIKTHRKSYQKGKSVIFAIVLRSDSSLIGAIGLQINQEHEKAELGYWIGKPFWNQGYCTEAAGKVIQFGFNILGLNRIYARHFNRNPASGRVLQKAGMQYEGCLRQHFKKWGVFEDIAFYGITKSDYREYTKS